MLVSRNPDALANLEAALSSVAVADFPEHLEGSVRAAQHSLLDQRAMLLRGLLIAGEDNPNSLRVIGAATALGMRLGHVGLSHTGRLHNFAYDGQLFAEGIACAVSKVRQASDSEKGDEQVRIGVEGVPIVLADSMRYAGQLAATRLDILGVLSSAEDPHQHDITAASIALGAGMTYEALRHSGSLPVVGASDPERFRLGMGMAIDQMMVRTPVGERS